MLSENKVCQRIRIGGVSNRLARHAGEPKTFRYAGPARAVDGKKPPRYGGGHLGMRDTDT